MQCGVVATDSRALKGGEMFFALKGENFDGNEYAMKALESGAAYAVVNRDAAVASSDDPRLIKVDDSLKTLQELARWHRSMMIVDGKPLTVIALTGTNGKTTTKELIREVLSVKYNVTATEGNLNNSIGVPLTLLKISKQTLLPAVVRYAGELARSFNAICDAGMCASAPKAMLETLTESISTYYLVTDALACALERCDEKGDIAEQAVNFRENVLPAMERVRAAADALECIVDKSYWPMPSYGELLFHIV
jgi:UDP-N-acetylmuramyl pentapeptide synthase